MVGVLATCSERVGTLGAAVPESPPAAPEAASAPLPPPQPTASARETRGRLPTLVPEQVVLLERITTGLDLDPEAVARLAKIFAGSKMLGQGNPTVSKHPMSRGECEDVRTAAGLSVELRPPCRSVNMAPLYDPGAGETAAQAKVCIDQFEFPGIPCEYPVVYARANEAAEICHIVGKRLCDAHEWEGACAGALHAPEVEYFWGKPRIYATWLHNQTREEVWAYGPQKDHSRCATASVKSERCDAGGWTLCGTNTWPAGSFPDCVSPFGVYDQHGNAAEHMNLPLAPDQLGSRGGSGATEMKGSWFIFARQEAHEDDCRWRAKDWHPSTVVDDNSHRNYHLGFRCCQDVADAPVQQPEADACRQVPSAKGK